MLQIVGQHMQAHLGADPIERFGKEVCRSHPGFDCSKWVLDGLATNAHALRCIIQAGLHGVQDRFMFPARNALINSLAYLYAEVSGRRSGEARATHSVLKPPPESSAAH